MPDHDFLVRTATPSDVSTIAHHRAEMFRDIHGLDDEQCAIMFAESKDALEVLVAAGDYLGWFASPAGEPERVIGGVGIRLRDALPSANKRSGPVRVVVGRQGL